MPAKALTAEQHDDARRLKAALTRAKLEFGLTQAELAARCGWESQSTVSQYANGRIPLNVDALGLMCIHLRVQMQDISPSLARRLAMLVQVLPKTGRARNLAEWPFPSIDRADFDRLAPADQRAIEQFARWVIAGRPN